MPIRTKTDCRHFADAPPESRSVCHIDLGSDAPDTSRQDAVAEQMANQSAEQFSWAQAQWEAEAPMREQAMRISSEVANEQMATMRQQREIADDYWNYQKGTFRPLEKRIVSDAEQFDTPERRQSAMTDAMAGTEQQLSLARASNNRNMTRMGVNPNSAKFGLSNNAMSLGAASAKASAGKQAADNIEQQGYARRMDAASLGRNLPANQATAAQIGIQAGNSAANNAQIPVGIGANAIQLMNQSAATANSGLSGAASIYGQSTNQRMQAGDNSGLFGALGAIGGGLAANPMLFAASDMNAKTDRKPVKPELSLAAIRKLPDSESWKYKDDSPHADGGMTHVGPMAQDVNRVMGEQTAPGGKAIDIVSMNGHTLNAIKALDKKVDKAISLASATKKGTK